MRLTLIAGFVVLFPIFLTAGCDEKSTNAVKDTAKSASSSAKDATAAISEQASTAFAAARDKAVEAFGPQIEEAKTMIASLRDKLSSASAEKKPAMESMLGGLETQFKSVTDMLASLKSAGADNWQEISAKLGDALKKLAAGLSDAKTQFGL